MAKTKKRKKAATNKKAELDSVYLLKLVLYIIVGAQWVFLVNGAGTTKIPLPFGLVIGLIFASHDHFKIDRKIEYAVLVVACLVGYFSRSGFFITY